MDFKSFLEANKVSSAIPPLKLENIKVTKQNDVAIYFDVIFVDSAGNRWLSENAQFFYDLWPVSKS